MGGAMIDVFVDRCNDTVCFKIGTEKVLSTYILTKDEFKHLQDVVLNAYPQ
jgi:hypothetical protein